MPPRKTRDRCQICDEKGPRYTCPGSGCLVEYCSVACYKQHKETSCNSELKRAEEQNDIDVSKGTGHGHGQGPQALSSDGEGDETIAKDVPLRPLTSLKWPYVPEESAYADPLKRDDPKPLLLTQYEAIATSPAVRGALRGAPPRLKELLRTIDGLRGSEREEALQVALGVSRQDVGVEGQIEPEIGEGIGGGERQAMRGLAEAIEAACREGEERGTLGLDWDYHYQERG